jgi:antitoxin (DNA-binding transcriptional repressor) of toxin-antitoxin stability system
MESYGANEARIKMRDILTAVERGDHVELRRYDTPTGVIVPASWYREVRSLLTDLDHPDARPEWQDRAMAIRTGQDGRRAQAHRPEARSPHRRGPA